MLTHTSSEKSTREKQKLKPIDRHRVAKTNRWLESNLHNNIVFHDLANHITSLLLSIGYLEDNLHRDHARLLEYAKKTERTRSQMEYVANILKSHMQQSKDSEINISKEILNVLSNFEARAQELKIIIRKNLPNKLLFFGDKRALTHIVSNLISNAIESFNDKSVSKVISVELKKFKNVILFSVTDSGSGINHENLDKIFKSGFTTKPKGHGIGLYEIKELIEKKFYGSINFKSSSGGTSFLIKIPMRNQTQ